ncbi:MAG: cation-translocating P-type ATPase family protein [Gemmataceae bacterium]
MHREISHTDEAFHQESNLSLYLLTGLLGVLIGLDLWPAIASYLASWGWALPTFPREIFGQRFALIAAVIGGARILYGSIESLLEGRLGADLALAIAAIAAILIGEPLVAAEVVFIGMLGECLESITFNRTQRAIQKIVEVFPRRCWVLRDGQEVRIRTNELQPGDVVVVKPGGRVPVDGVVIAGRSSVDASALTGESLPVDKGAGDEVLAGSLNQFGALTIRAERVAEHTVMGRVIELTSKALKDKAPLQRTADRLAKYFLPIVLSLATLTFLVVLLYHWGPVSAAASRTGLYEAVRLAVYPTLAVLVVACPCALILATPAAIIAALGRLAGTGVLIKGGSALERLAEVQAFAFDKTGTLTEGKLELGDVVGIHGISNGELLWVAASAEQRSEHPVARLILEEARRRDIALAPISEFLAHPGAGVAVRTDHHSLLVGTRRLMEEQRIPLPEAIYPILDQLDATGQTALLVARDGVILGAIGARDRVRPEAAAVIAELQAAGIQPIALLTGDRAAVARTIAEPLGISEVHAELLPEQKAEFVARWSEQHGKVAMVGDGINDAPALARAAVGLAIGGTGTDIAAEAGDVVLMGDPLQPLPMLLRLSRQTVHIIRQNILIFAFIVNGLGILLTAWLWPLFAPSPEWYEQAPLAGVIYHQLGSLAVLLNAMRLLWFERAAASPTWLRIRHAMQRIDQWMEHHLNADELLHELSHHWKPVAAVVVLVALFIYALSGLTVVGPDEVAVARRFGRPVGDQPNAHLESGLHWRWPWPIEEITRVKPDQVRTVPIGFRAAANPVAAAPAALGWSSPHGGDGILRVPEEAVMITGDGNLIELQATVRYRVDRDALHTYLFEVRDPDAIVRSLTEATLREEVASQPFFDLLTINREQFQRAVLKRLEQRSRRYGPQGLGIRFDGLSLHDVHPPQEVVGAYHDVARAMEQFDQLINRAQSEATRKVSNAEADALVQVRRAEAEYRQKVTQAETERDNFLARQRSRRQLSAQEEWALVQEALSIFLQSQDVEAALDHYVRRRQQAVARAMFLTDFRLFWDTLATVLGGRDKVIIDSDKLPGRRHLFLIDPDQMRPPPPVLLQPDRNPERSRMHERP